MANESWEYRLKESVRWDSEDVENDVINFVRNEFVPKWHLLVDKKPHRGQKVWCMDLDGNYYFAQYVPFYNIWANRIKGYYFQNLMGRGWSIKDVVKWTPVKFP